MWGYVFISVWELVSTECAGRLLLMARFPPAVNGGTPSLYQVVDILLHLKAGGIPSGGSFRFDSPTEQQVSANLAGCSRSEWVRLLGVPSPRYSYPPPYVDSQSCFRLGESGRLRWTWSYFLCGQHSGTTLGHCSSQPFTGLVSDIVSLLGADRPSFERRSLS
jgi:hypothetical protein